MAAPSQEIDSICLSHFSRPESRPTFESVLIGMIDGKFPEKTYLVYSSGQGAYILSF